MSSTNLHAFSKVKHLVDTILQQLPITTKPQYKFMISLFEVWLRMPLKYTVLNLARFGDYCEKSIRLQMSKPFDFVRFNKELIKRSCGKELIAAFDPTFLHKSGKLTPGIGNWWSGKDQKSLKGLEVGCLAIIDVKSRTAMSLKAVQTPGKKELIANGLNLISHYVKAITGDMCILKSMVKYLTVDAYFMKKDFILPMMDQGLHIITKMRSDANLSYIYNGAKRPGRGRPRTRDGKVVCSQIDKRRIREFAVDNDAVYYSGIVWSAILNRKVRILVVEQKGTDHYEILMSTDTELAPGVILEYYRLRFQIEFLIRDAKQYAGLEQCQLRSKEKLHFHFNMAFTTVGLGKAIYWLKSPADQKEAFSMRNIKIAWYNRYLTDRIFSNLGLDLNCGKIKRLYHKCLKIADWAA